MGDKPRTVMNAGRMAAALDRMAAQIILERYLARRRSAARGDHEAAGGADDSGVV